jgi:hypothetical protein
VAAGGSLGPVQLHHLLGMSGQEPGQAGAVAAGAFNRPDALAWLLLGQCQQLAVAGRGRRHRCLGDHRSSGGGHDRSGVGVLVGVDPDDELDGLCQHGHALTPLPGDDVTGRSGPEHGRTVMGHARLASGGQAPDQASSLRSGPMPAAASGQVRRKTPPGSVIPRVTSTTAGYRPDHHRTTGQSHSHSTKP